MFAAALIACSPTYDWREVRGSGAPYTVMLPAKPSSHARPIDLDGIQVTMTMTAAEAGGATFAVGTAEMRDPAQASQAVAAMKTAMLRNIGANAQRESPLPQGTKGTKGTGVEVEALGPVPDGKSRVLLARFIAIDKRVFQLVILGQEGEVPQEAADVFFTSFNPG